MPFSSLKPLIFSKPIVIFGRDGQIGKALQEVFKDSRMPIVFLGRSDCDLANEASITKVLAQYQPQIIINAAAYTAVDQAENEPDLVFAINVHAPQVMAHYIANLSHGIFVHYSTDYVFADTKQTAYIETDVTGPSECLSIYGQSKLAGEQAIEEMFRLVQNLEGAHDENHFPRYFILRTSWVFGDGDNFIRAILRSACQRDQLEVVADQVGVPTSAKWLAKIAIQMINSELRSGIYHAVPDGETSWHGLAIFAIDIAASVSEAIQVKSENIRPIPATDYLLPGKRPYNSRMNNQKLKQALVQMAFTRHYPHWQEQVTDYVREYVVHSLKS